MKKKYFSKTDCDAPTIANGIFSPSITSHGVSVEISCDTGFSLEGESTLTCSDGSWDKTLPTCHKGEVTISFKGM